MTHTKRPFKLLPNIPHVIFCEGQDEEMFLRYYIEYLVNKKLVPDTFNIINLGSNEEMRKTLHLFPSLDYFDQMKGFLVVRDAESNAIGAAQSIQQSLKDAFQISIAMDGSFVENQEGMRFGFVLLPGKEREDTFSNGTLEDLCCQILNLSQEEFSGNNLLKVVDSYLDEVQQKRDCSFRTPHKNRLHAYLSGTDSFVGMKIGEASKAKCFDFSSHALDFLKNAILQLAL